MRSNVPRDVVIEIKSNKPKKTKTTTTIIYKKNLNDFK